MLGVKNNGCWKCGYEKWWVWKMMGVKNVGMKNMGVKNDGYEKCGYEKWWVWKMMGAENVGMKHYWCEKCQ